MIEWSFAALPSPFLFFFYSLWLFAQKQVSWVSRCGRLGLFLLQPSCCWKPLLSQFISVSATTRAGIYSDTPVDSKYNPDAFLGILFPQYLPITDNSADSQANLNPNLTGRKFASYSVFACQGLKFSLHLSSYLLHSRASRVI